MDEHTAVKNLIVILRELEKAGKAPVEKGGIPKVIGAVNAYPHQKHNAGKGSDRRQNLNC